MFSPEGCSFRRIRKCPLCSGSNNLFDTTQVFKVSQKQKKTNSAAVSSTPPKKPVVKRERDPSVNEESKSPTTAKRQTFFDLTKDSEDEVSKSVTQSRNQSPDVKLEVVERDVIHSSSNIAHRVFLSPSNVPVLPNAVGQLKGAKIVALKEQICKKWNNGDRCSSDDRIDKARTDFEFVDSAFCNLERPTGLRVHESKVLFLIFVNLFSAKFNS